VSKGETARLYASVGLIYAIENFLAILVYRYVYDVSLETFPSAYLLLSSAIFSLAGITSFILYTQKRFFDRKEKEDEEEEKRENIVVELKKKSFEQTTSKN
jgi:hypothetical protein